MVAFLRKISGFAGLLSLGTDEFGKINLHIKEIHPKHLLLNQDELLSVLKTEEIKSILCPIQSGNNRILELMQREHTAEDIMEAFLKIRDINSNIVDQNTEQRFECPSCDSELTEEDTYCPNCGQEFEEE